MQNKPEQDRNQEATVYLGNLDDRCTDALIWELMLQAGPVSNVFLPKDRISMNHQGFGFCEFLSEEDADYAVKIMNQIKLYGKPIRVNKASYDTNKKPVDVGANLFIGSLDEGVDENALFDTFSTFGSIAEQPKIARDPSTGRSKGYGFVSYHDFEAADMAIENMNGQFFGGKQISVQYAFKKDGKGERHGTQAERLLAAQAKKQALMPGGGATGGFSYQGQYAGALAAQPSAPVQPAYIPPQPTMPAPPPGVPVYQPQQTYPGYPPSAPPGVPAGHPQGFAPPPPAGFPIANGYPGYPPQAQSGGAAPPPPPPIRMGFE